MHTPEQSRPPIPAKSAPETSASDPSARTIAVLLQIEQEARAAEDTSLLGYIIANRTRALIRYERAVFVALTPNSQVRVLAISNTAVVEDNAPMVVWLRDFVRRLGRDATGLSKLRAIDIDGTGQDSPDDAYELWSGTALWVPMGREGEAPHGGLLMVRSAGAWTEAERTLVMNLADCYGHAWRALRPRRHSLGRGRRAIAGWLVAGAVVAAMAIPVPRSVIAPAHVEPRDPVVIAAPMEGVIEQVLVAPNQTVKAGDVLFRYVAAEQKASLDVAEQSFR